MHLIDQVDHSERSGLLEPDHAQETRAAAALTGDEITGPEAGIAVFFHEFQEMGGRNA
ncbi:hypothetical protein [Agrobacterium albertimagni]|uniref:hypothetical protein n=1 Tax=Agrobacterium albertimagni TaxID=147266 RepID=UPI0002F6B918|nr:hypothetical protein [Agrobacterium albertimagni]